MQPCQTCRKQKSYKSNASFEMHSAAMSAGNDGIRLERICSLKSTWKKKTVVATAAAAVGKKISSQIQCTAEGRKMQKLYFTFDAAAADVAKK